MFEADDLDPPQVSFVIDKLEVGQISDPVPMKTEDGKDAYRILMLKKKTIPPHKANLKDDYSRIQMLALQEKKAAEHRQMDTQQIKISLRKHRRKF